MKARVDVALTGTAIEKAYRELRPGDDLSGERFDPAAHAPEALAEATRYWHARMAAEHRSAPVFLLLGAQLIEANAPLDAKAVMLGMAQDELRHTELCGRVLRAFGAEPAVNLDVTVTPLARHDGCTPAERALRNVIYTTCLSEMIAVGALVDSLEHTSDAFVRAATRSILADEVMHGRYGFLYLESLREPLDDATRAGLLRYLRHAFAVLERDMMGPLDLTQRPSAGARALGVMAPARLREVFHASLEHAIVPGLEAHGIAAEEAWRTRALATPTAKSD